MNPVFYKKSVYLVLSIFVSLLILLPAYGEDEKEQDGESPTGIFDHLGENILNSFIGWPALLHAAAIGSTYYLVNSDADARVNDFAVEQDKTMSYALGVPGLAGGGIAPVAVPLAMYLAADGDRDLQRGAYAVFQAVGIAFLANSMLKAATGRMPPDEEHTGTSKELSRQFQFGFLRGGVFDGWPSGHSMVNMAMIASLLSYYPEKKWLWPAGFSWALYVMASVVLGAQGRVHWLSDAVAGGLMGFGIGWTVGRRFYRDRMLKRHDNAEDVSREDEFSIYLVGNASGVTIMAIIRI
jgi:membrane-associated phospholipid phosphatase